jgi:hypothetical protein
MSRKQAAEAHGRARSIVSPSEAIAQSKEQDQSKRSDSRPFTFTAFRDLLN